MVKVCCTALLAAALSSSAAVAQEEGTHTRQHGMHRGPAATAVLQNADGKTVGDATLRESPAGVLIRAEFRDVPPGTHAFHVHEVGTCEAPSFESAGSHLNPDGKKHGLLGQGGPHAGDMPNVHVPENGRLTIEILASRVTLSSGKTSLFDQNGSALVLHAGADDYRTDPAGDAGDRIACGVISMERG